MADKAVRLNEKETITTMGNNDLIVVTLENGDVKRVKKSDLYPVATTTKDGLMSATDKFYQRRGIAGGVYTKICTLTAHFYHFVFLLTGVNVSSVSNSGVWAISLKGNKEPTVGQLVPTTSKPKLFYKQTGSTIECWVYISSEGYAAMTTLNSSGATLSMDTSATLPEGLTEVAL